ncbi:MAG: PAS domain S-box protein [bacterium]
MGDQDKSKDQLIKELQALRKQVVELNEAMTKPKASNFGIQEGEQKYRTLIERFNEGILEVDNDDVIKFVNDRFCELSGYSRDELFGKVAHKLLLSKENQIFMNGKIRLRRQKISDRYEIQMKKKSGDTILVRVSGTPVLDDNGKVIGSIGIHIDITEQKRAEEALRESEERFRKIFEEGPLGMAIVNSHYRLVKVNTVLCKMLGYTEQELIALTFLDITHPEENKKDVHFAERLFRGEIPYYKIEKRYIKKNKEILWGTLTASIIRDEYGKPLYGLGMIEDITERKQMEKALRESEERLSAIINNTPNVAVQSYDLNGRILSWNKAAENIFGWTQDEALGKNIDKLIFDKDSTYDFYSTLKDANKTKRPFGPKEWDFTHKNGTKGTVYSTLFPIVSTEGNKEFICMYINITEYKRLQEELARAQRLESAGRVAGQIAHDFNNLLAPLTAYPTLIREELPENYSILEMVDEMESAANKIAEINQQLLALGRRGHYSMEPIDLNDLAQKVVLSQPLPKEIIVHEELSSDLFLIKGGAAQLSRALTNLIINAKEAMQGIGVLTIKTENVYLDNPLRGYQTIKRGEYVVLKVSDTGIGIEPEILDKIFDPFFTTKKMDRLRGSGLGLSVIHGIIEDHKGYITVDSTLGQGTTFTLYFPVTREIEIQAAEVVKKTKGGQEKILIIDDDPVQRRVAGQLLKRLGYKVHTVSSGEQAVKYVKMYPQDLLLLDMVMDGIDGAETYRQILENQPEQKAILFSGYAMSPRVQDALRLGAGSFISKPLTLKTLATAVRKELDKKWKKRPLKFNN